MEPLDYETSYMQSSLYKMILIIHINAYIKSIILTIKVQEISIMPYDTYGHIDSNYLNTVFVNHGARSCKYNLASCQWAFN